jgi:hypothetical protein
VDLIDRLRTQTWQKILVSALKYAVEQLSGKIKGWLERLFDGWDLDEEQREHVRAGNADLVRALGHYAEATTTEIDDAVAELLAAALSDPDPE